MNWAWASSLDQIWRSPTFPMWLTLAAAGFFGIIVLITLLRAEKSVANGALTVITLLAIGVAVAATIRGFGPDGQLASAEPRSGQPVSAALPALSCIDDLAGDAVLNACEKTLLCSPDAAAAALPYAAAQITPPSNIRTPRRACPAPKPPPTPPGVAGQSPRLALGASPELAAAKKPAARRTPAAPVQIAPAAAPAAQAPPAQPPAVSND